MKNFDNIREFTYIGNRVIVDGEELKIATPLPLESSQSKVKLYAVQSAKDLIENPQYTPKEQHDIDMYNWRASRKLSVEHIEVTHKGDLFKGDEDSQNYIMRAIATLDDDTTAIPYPDKNGKDVALNRIDLKGILRASFNTQNANRNIGRPTTV